MRIQLVSLLVTTVLMPVATEVVDDIFEAMEEDSDGGRQITKDELKEIFRDAGEALASGVAEVVIAYFSAQGVKLKVVSKVKATSKEHGAAIADRRKARKAKRAARRKA